MPGFITKAAASSRGARLGDDRRSLPLTFALTGSSRRITDAKAKVSYARVVDGVVGTCTNAQATDRSGNTFVHSDGQYRFHWRTSTLAAAKGQATPSVSTSATGSITSTASI